MSSIAISYRRSDSSAMAGRIYDRLAAHYGEHSVFMDIDNIPLGADFRSHIQESLRRADVLIAVIGPKWLGTTADGMSRMQEKTDPVRLEIETALAGKKPIIPVLIDGARMPNSSELPPEFGNFSYLNAAEVSTGCDFRSHMDRLVGAIDRITGKNPSADQPQPSVTSVAAPSEAPQPPLASRAWHPWSDDLVRHTAVPFVLLLVIHHIVINAYDLNVAYLQIACAAVPFVFGATFSLLGARGPAIAASFAVGLGILGDAGMTVSQSLYSGDPVMPQSRVEWWDNLDYAAIIALSYFAGYVLARSLRRISNRRWVKP